MDIVMPGRFTVQMLKPRVAGFLHELRQELSCGETWTRPSKDGTSIEEFCTTPLSSNIVDPGGIRTHVSSEQWLGEHRGQKDALGVESRWGHRAGYIKLNAGLDAWMGVSKGVEVFKDFDDGRRRFLCRADEYVLQDGTRSFRITTHAGVLWIRGAEQEAPRKQMLHTGLGHEAAPRYVGHTIVQVAEYDYVCNVGGSPFYEQLPWDGMTNVDHEERPWEIVPKPVVLRCSLRLNVVGHYSDWMKDRPRHILEQPYQTVWERWSQEDSDVSILLPLDY